MVITKGMGETVAFFFMRMWKAGSSKTLVTTNRVRTTGLNLSKMFHIIVTNVQKFGTPAAQVMYFAMCVLHNLTNSVLQ